MDQESKLRDLESRIVWLESHVRQAEEDICFLRKLLGGTEHLYNRRFAELEQWVGDLQASVANLSVEG